MKTLRPRTTTRTWTPLVLRPLQVEMDYILKDSLDCLGFLDDWNGAPPIIYIEGRHPLHGRELCSSLLEPPLWANERVTHRSLKVVGPMGWSADQGGRLATQLGPPTFSFFGWAAPGVHLSMVEVWAFVMLDFFSGGLSIHVKLVWRCLLEQCLAPKLKRVWLPSISI